MQRAPAPFAPGTGARVVYISFTKQVMTGAAVGR
jgi:hypothetical protein